MKHHSMVSRTATLIALGVLAGSACAQSSVTIFGVVDAAMRSAHTDNAGHVNSLVSGAYSSSRFGFRGQEDLGGGLSASFWLESFLNTDTGTTTPAGFQRRSTVSLSQRDWGELRLGRDYTPTHSNWARFDPFGYVGLGAVQLFALSATGNTPATAAFGTAPNTIQRANNGVQYLLPRNAWGLEGGLAANFGENGTAANDQHKSGGGRLGINLGPVFVSAATFNTHDDKTVGAFKDSALAASYDASLVRISGGVRRFEYQAARQNNYLLAAVIPVGVQEFKFSWNRASMDGRVGTVNISNDRADQFAVGYVYHLSKRTHAYTTLATIRNKGNSRFVVPGAPAGAAGVTSRGFELGVNHEF
ncbi:porin [Xylophilus sp. GW821-FHT01B05]